MYSGTLVSTRLEVQAKESKIFGLVLVGALKCSSSFPWTPQHTTVGLLNVLSIIHSPVCQGRQRKANNAQVGELTIHLDCSQSLHCTQILQMSIALAVRLHLLFSETNQGSVSCNSVWNCGYSQFYSTHYGLSVWTRIFHFEKQILLF